jgi:hypothetical protein
VLLPRRPQTTKHSDFVPGPGTYESAFNFKVPAYSIGKGKRLARFSGSAYPAAASYSPKKETTKPPAYSVGRTKRSISISDLSPGPAQYEPKDQLPSSPRFSMRSRNKSLCLDNAPVMPS